MVKGYKVVRKYDGVRYSMIVTGKAQVQYIPYKWVYPPEWLEEKGCGLCVFSNLDSAKEFALNHSYPTLSGVEIWECEYTQAKRHPLCLLTPLSVGYTLYISRGEPLWPDGTRHAKKVRLIRNVTAEVLSEYEEVENGLL